MLFDESDDAVHVLNGSAAFIWDCLKAPVTADKIEDIMRQEYDLAKVPDVPVIIQRALSDLLAKKLIEPVPSETHGSPKNQFI